MTVVPFPINNWTWESGRGRNRAVRVSPHPDEGLVSLSFWRDDRCAGTVRLTPDEAASLIGRLGAALAELSGPGEGDEDAPDSVEARVAAVEQRLQALEAIEASGGPQALGALGAVETLKSTAVDPPS